MIPYSYPIGITLCGFTASSFLSLVRVGSLRGDKKADINLPDNTENEGPLNVIQPLDLLDGLPTREEEFWANVRPPMRLRA